MARVAGESHLALRVVAALAVAATVWLAGRVARALGGGAFARALAGIATGLAPVVLSLGSYYSMNALDLLFWALIALLLVRVLSGGGERLWLAFGAAAGLGLLNKISVLYLGFGLAVGLVLARRWDVFRSRLFWAGGLLAASIFLPHLAWQHATGWPTLEFMANARRYKMAPLSPPGFLAETLLHTAPAAWLWILGVAWLVSRAGPGGGAPRLRLPGRPGRARPRRRQALLPRRRLLARVRGRRRGRRRAHGRPRAPPPAAPRRPSCSRSPSPSPRSASPSCRWRRTCATRRRSASSPGPASATSSGGCRSSTPTCTAGASWRRRWPASSGPAARGAGQGLRLRPELRPGGCDRVLRPRLDLPPALSGHNSYWLWGPGSCTGEVLVVIGDGRERLEERFSDVRLGAVTRCTNCMPYEDAQPIWVARGPKQSIRDVWPQVKHFD